VNKQTKKKKKEKTTRIKVGPSDNHD